MELSEFFQKHPVCAVAISGGVDSSYLLYAAKACGAQVRAYYVKSSFQPRFELDDARKITKLLEIDMTVIELDVLNYPEIISNPANRCYFCKRLILSTISMQAGNDGYHTILDGTNASDSVNERSGMRAIRELSILSPLRECGLTKEKIRELSREAGLFTWNKPAYACLATRIPMGEAITWKKLENTERAENYLFSLGFRDFRVRMSGETALIQVPLSQFSDVILQREAIIKELKQYYSVVTLDLEVRGE